MNKVPFRRSPLSPTASRRTGHKLAGCPDDRLDVQYRQQLTAMAILTNASRRLARIMERFVHNGLENERADATQRRPKGQQFARYLVIGSSSVAESLPKSVGRIVQYLRCERTLLASRAAVVQR